MKSIKQCQVFNIKPEKPQEIKKTNPNQNHHTTVSMTQICIMAEIKA